MAKNLFRPQQIVSLTKQVVLDPPFNKVEEKAPVASVEEYTGPTADDLRREAELFKQNWEQERENMISSAREEADKIIKEAEDKAFRAVKSKTDEAEKTTQDAKEEAERIVHEAEEEARKKQEEAQTEVERIRREAYDEGLLKGRDEGYKAGADEVERLTEVMHQVVNRSIEKRNEIIEEAETQLINLVLLIAKKVIKVISENQKNVVVNNVIQALRKMKSRGDVVVRVNLDDVQMATEHVKDFMRMVENVTSITVLEDSSVDKGGCIIETDFGQIDARISSQLHEIEERILELAPIKSKGESDGFDV